MLALSAERLGEPEVLRLAELPDPEAGDGVLIEVHAAGVSFPDLLMVRGRYQYRHEPPFVPGLEVAGLVREAPPGSPLAPGDRVSAMVGLGGYAELATAPERAVTILPAGLDFAEGVALMVNYQTAYFALCHRGRLAAGETVLVHGAAGGVGIAAIQVAAALGARTIAVARGAAKAELAGQAGAAEVIDIELDSDWVAAVREISGGEGIDVVYDPVGGSRFEHSLRVLAPGGRALVIGFAAGEIQAIPANRLLLKNVDAVGVAWGHYLEHDPDLLARIAAELADLVAAGLRPIVGAAYPLAEGAAALRELASRRALGKVVLTVR